MPPPPLLYRREWPAADLIAAHPARIHHPHKQLLYDVAALTGAPSGRIAVSRWGPLALPEALTGDIGIAEAVGYYTYDDPEPGEVDWHQNFADPQVFGFYAGPLYAQDEMQVAEHPALASVHEALTVDRQARTADASGPTPVLVAGVERRVTLDTAPSLEPGRTSGLYGNRFAAASAATIRSATQRIAPPSVSNIVALAAPHPSSGRYTAAQIRAVLETAYAGYAACVAESARLHPGARVVIHTGFWGCGAFGGNRVLMVALQTVAARLAGVATVVFHVGERGGLHDTAEARRALARLPASGPVTAFVAAVEAMGLVWGQSDGN